MIKNLKIIRNRQQNIGIITKPIGKGASVPLSNLIDIIHSFSDPIYIITGGDGMDLMKKKDLGVLIFEVKSKNQNNILLKILNQVYTQLGITLNLMGPAKRASIWIFFLDSHSFLLPVFVSRLLRKKTIFLLAASIKNSAKAQNSILSKIFVYSEVITYKLSNCIIVYTPNLVKEWNIEKYIYKISIASEHILDLENFNVRINLNQRDNHIAYIGRLSEEKGILEFIKAIPKFSKRICDVKFIIGGDGHLRSEVEKYLRDNSLTDSVELIGWIPHDELPKHLNKTKLIVLPSFSEGLPNIMLEAMACGTPILANPVGAIPSIIKDGETGFIMDNNSPECIAANVIRALEHPDLEGIAKRARVLVEHEYTFERALDRWRVILEEVCDEK